MLMVLPRCFGHTIATNHRGRNHRDDGGSPLSFEMMGERGDPFLPATEGTNEVGLLCMLTFYTHAQVSICKSV